MARPRAADDFATIRSRMEELRRERMQAVRGHTEEPSEERRRYPWTKSVEPEPKPYLRPSRNLLER